MDGGELVAAIDALVAAVREYESLSVRGQPFTASEVSALHTRINELDAHVYALAAVLGLTIPLSQQGDCQFIGTFGQTGIPCLRSAAGTDYFASPDWLQSMAGLRKTAEIVRRESEAPQLEEAPAPIGFYTPPTRGSNSGCTHSPDFRSVKWFSVGYSFTANQAACVKLLWESWEQGCPEVGGATVLEAAGIHTERFDHVFRGHPALGKMIVPGQTKGSYRLQENPPADAKPACGS